MQRQELYNPKQDRGKREYWSYKCGRKSELNVRLFIVPNGLIDSDVFYSANSHFQGTHRGTSYTRPGQVPRIRYFNL
jgi:hypothetical protein